MLSILIPVHHGIQSFSRKIWLFPPRFYSRPILLPYLNFLSVSVFKTLHDKGFKSANACLLEFNMVRGPHNFEASNRLKKGSYAGFHTGIESSYDAASLHVKASYFFVPSIFYAILLMTLIVWARNRPQLTACDSVLWKGVQAKDLLREVVGLLQPQAGRAQRIRGHAGVGRLPDQPHQAQHPKVDSRTDRVWPRDPIQETE